MKDFINRFEINNFKKFNHLVVEDLGVINLITGDNNVGKTCLLEALVIGDDMKKNLVHLLHTLNSRGFFIDEKYKHRISETEFNQKNNVIGLFQQNYLCPIEFKISNLKNEEKTLIIGNEIIDIITTENIKVKEFSEKLKRYPEINTLSKNWILFYINSDLNYMIDITSSYYNQFLKVDDYIPIVTLNDFFREDLIEMYDEVVGNLESKVKFIETLNFIFPTISILDIQSKNIYSKNQLTIATKDNSNFHSITQYGGGFVRVLRIALEMIIAKGKRLMIDEIDTGIHYLKIKTLWSAIIKLALEFEVQLFATTHSKECINALVEAANEGLKDKDVNVKEKVRLIELDTFENKEKELVNKATTKRLERIEFGLEVGENLLGGNVWK
jgi:AAA15 family ATPase/GTPase